MNIGKQRRFSELYRSTLTIVGVMWLMVTSVFAADELPVSSQGPAALQEPMVDGASASEQVPAALQETVTDESVTQEQIPAVLQNTSVSETPEMIGEPAPDEPPSELTATASEANEVSVSPENTDSVTEVVSSEIVATDAPAASQATDDSMPATNVNQEIITRPEFVDPKVKRNDIHVAAIDNENFEFGLFVGMYSTEDFGTSPVYGLKVAYHVNEAIFFEVTGGVSKTQRTSAEDILNVDFLSEAERDLTYYNFSFGYNALPSETYFGEGWAFHSAIYVIGGAGFTEFAGDSFFTLNFGVGYRFLVTDWLALHLDVRDHLFEMDLLGKKKTTQNIELSTGVSFFF